MTISRKLIFQCLHILYAFFHISVVIICFNRLRHVKCLLAILFLSVGLALDNFVRAVSPTVLGDIKSNQNLTRAQLLIRNMTGLSYLLHGTLPSFLLVVAYWIYEQTKIKGSVETGSMWEAKHSNLSYALILAFSLSIACIWEFATERPDKHLKIYRSYGIHLFRAKVDTKRISLALLNIFFGFICFLISSYEFGRQKISWTPFIHFFLLFLAFGALPPPNVDAAETNFNFFKFAVANGLECLYVLAIIQTTNKLTTGKV